MQLFSVALSAVSYANIVQYVHLYEVYEIHFRTAISHTFALQEELPGPRKSKVLQG